MKQNNLCEKLEAILFIAGDGIDKELLIDKLEVSKQKMQEAVESLKEKYKESGVNLIEYKNKIQFCSNPEYASVVAEVLNPIREKKLSRATLETMAIIAYKQPITRLEIENIRGVSSDYAVQNLIKHNLIEVIGRKDTIGKPLLFATTDTFLKRFELSDLSDLPNYDELLESIKIINEENKKDALYNEFEVEEVEEKEEIEDYELPSEEEIINRIIKDEPKDINLNKEITA